MDEKMDEKEAQKKYMELQLLHQQIKHAQKQIETLDEQQMELLITNQSLDELKKIKPDSEILIPLSSGIFVKGSLKGDDELLVNVGSMTAVAKRREDTMMLINEQVKEIEKVKQNITMQLQKLAMKSNSVEVELTNFIQEKG